ncbi:MAG: UDP-N-acetylmuramoyl-L-alanyl-D-glutamate--2,6-diaminopimelate ligase [Bacteroidales bacterium]|nr:UDP-N-acetylmuramoyl-L-alanyl-D-glutamate--2,6-diaminopimelate ligase [Bacteroidales bacterium]
MTLDKILQGMQCSVYLLGRQVEKVPEVEIKDIVFDSREVTAGSLFVARRGVRVDGHRYIMMAIKRGAMGIICEELPDIKRSKRPIVQVNDSDLALGIAASNFYGNPSRHLHLVGITGTNGKTTTVTLLQHLVRNMGMHAGLLSTIVNRIDEEEVAANHTTPDAVELNRLLRQMVEHGCEYCFMEVSSHAVVQKRIAGLHFAGAIFSNITHDHLDYHGTMENYIAAKKAFFDALDSDAFALTNIDDKNGRVMVQNTQARVYTYSLRAMADYRSRIVESTVEGQELELNGRRLWTRLVGRFNAYNITAITAAALLCGLDEERVLRGVSELEAAKGRFEVVRGADVTAIIDYAHTPDALQNVMDTILDVRGPQQRLIAVVGCGGDRDPLKRPIMGYIAAQRADQLVLTSDNPRSEDPEQILNAMERDLSLEQRAKTVRISDRRQAIRTAFIMARPDDIVLIAGKGHETYQEVRGERHHFDDREEAEQAIQMRLTSNRQIP